MLWRNFAGRHGRGGSAGGEDWAAASDRFGEVTGHPGARLPSPELPTTPLKPRGRVR
ncbi:hypothetical protein ACFUGD_18400 [Streptomyces sp. NPDC057217]|uniref:hypothetical protein n=1 Tax=Streptomyces sp. NPDC057217 TaxID=3346054 RepID=UPI0036449778